MKKIFTMLMVASIFSLVACGPTAEENGAKESDATTKVDEATPVSEETAEEPASEATGEELADHVCNDNCTADACSFTHGEKGHTCDDSCHGDSEGHDHDHDHEGEEGHSEEG
ncbi:MAG: hypothetical protein JKY52_01140 [Flavobacteriales bacterium]|nr:hypothetical protein [Flavobacteriales bacterium]